MMYSPVESASSKELPLQQKVQRPFKIDKLLSNLIGIPRVVCSYYRLALDIVMPACFSSNVRLNFSLLQSRVGPAN